MISVLPSIEEGGGCERLTIFMQSRVPLGPSKFHIVVLVSDKTLMCPCIKNLLVFSTPSPDQMPGY